jgi:hypothetical protein
MARVTGLEPATSGVTGRRSNQLSYTRAYAVNTRSPLFRALPYGLQRPVSIHCNSGFSGMIQMMPVTM